ncbi:hypothetical protein GCM10010960_07320 [Arenimonas maotaiensis]|uniref:Uncharacterized protein n=1 Tax=Arenimonas maotaiensis TaxID=1446479 RepID=A0A917CHG5_9GAMM|nr:hypothetical protein GCM10010960_07320 [Arenimonas maotaiensis]
MRLQQRIEAVDPHRQQLRGLRGKGAESEQKEDERPHTAFYGPLRANGKRVHGRIGAGYRRPSRFGRKHGRRWKKSG